MEQYLNGVDISTYKSGEVDRLCEYFKSVGTPLSIAQVEVTGGTYNDTVKYETEKTILDVVNNGLHLGYYAFLYPEGPGLSTAEQQAKAFVNVYREIKEKHGITPDCKIMIDVEESGFKEVNIEPSTEMVTHLINTFANVVDSELGKQEYVVYASASFISAYYGEIDPNKYGVIVSSIEGTYSMEEINYPKYPYTPINYSKYPNNWGDDWTGVQFNFGYEEDYDIYKESFLINDKSIPVIPSFKNGDYVKLTANTAYFAPDIIPEKFKLKNYKIINTFKNQYELSEINRYLYGDELKKITINPPTSTKHTTQTSGDINASLLEKAAVMIALDEGFSRIPYDYGVGEAGHSAGYGTNVDQFSSSDYPLSPMFAWDTLLRVLREEYIPICDKAIEKYFGDTLTECQKCAIYTFGYNLTGYVDDLVQRLSINDSWENTFSHFLIPSSLYGRRRRSWNTFVNNKFDLFMSNVSILPNEEIKKLAYQMNGNS